MCVVEKGVRGCWTVTDDNKTVIVIVIFPQDDPSLQKNNVLWSLATRALHHTYYPAGATDWCVFSLPPESYPLIFHLLPQHNCTEAIAGIVRVTQLIPIYPLVKLQSRTFRVQNKSQHLWIKKCCDHFRSRKITINMAWLFDFWYSFPLFNKERLMSVWTFSNDVIVEVIVSILKRHLWKNSFYLTQSLDFVINSSDWTSPKWGLV